MKRYTNKDISRLAGVSPAAVSLAINGRKGVSDETRARILKLVKEYNYHPNPSSRRLLQDRTNNIAVLVRNDLCPIDQLFYTELTESILNTSNQNVINLVFTTLRDNTESHRLPQSIVSLDVDGVLIYGDVDDDVLAELNNLGMPFVILDSSRANGEFLTVSADYALAAYTATQYLIEYGHRDIAYLGNGYNAQIFFNDAVFSGFRRALQENGIDLAEERVQVHAQDEASLHVSIEHLLYGKKMPTALFCSTDVYACTAIRYLNKKGFTLPDMLSIIAIDDVLISQFTTPALTTVKIDREVMGREGYNLLNQLIAGEDCISIVLPSSQLMIRDSVSKPRQSGS